MANDIKKNKEIEERLLLFLFLSIFIFLFFIFFSIPLATTFFHSSFYDLPLPLFALHKVNMKTRQIQQSQGCNLMQLPNSVKLLQSNYIFKVKAINKQELYNEFRNNTIFHEIQKTNTKFLSVKIIRVFS